MGKDRLYTGGEAVSLAGRIIGGLIEIVSRFFFILAEIFAWLVRIFFSIAGVGIDGYNALSRSDMPKAKTNPKLRQMMKEAVFLAAGDSEGWEWVDEAIAPIRHNLAANHNAFVERKMKKVKIIGKDADTVVMSVILKEIVVEALIARDSPGTMKWLKASGGIVENFGDDQDDKYSLATAKSGIMRFMAEIRAMSSSCCDDPIRKASLLVSASKSALEFHRSGKVKFRDRMVKALAELDVGNI